MTNCSLPILVKGRYRIVALTPSGEDDLDLIPGYAVLTSAGTKLRHELTLDDAKTWMDALIEKEDMTPAVPPRTWPARVRR